MDELKRLRGMNASYKRQHEKMKEKCAALEKLNNQKPVFIHRELWEIRRALEMYIHDANQTLKNFAELSEDSKKMYEENIKHSESALEKLNEYFNNKSQ